MEKLQELFTDRVNNTLGATKKHFYDKFEVEQNLNRLDMLKQFIKWLVDNDKIDKSKVFSFIDTDDKPYEDILCLLALSDTPIEDLISYLK